MNTLTTMQETLVSDIRTIINNARTTAVRSVDFCRVQMYWQLGKRIFEEEQQGKERADYGSYLIKNLALRLEPEYGSGFGHRQLERARQFYREYPIASAVRSQLNWAQYRLLMQIPDPDKREYYELEAVNNAWTGRELKRQIDSLLYERLLMSNDKESVLAVARKERIPESPTEIVKDPMVVELKTGELTHQDLGQLQMYVNYYDRTERVAGENPTIGILLCTRKNDTMVRMALPEDNNTILASQYQLYLPTIEQLQAEVEEVKRLARANETKVENE